MNCTIAKYMSGSSLAMRDAIDHGLGASQSTNKFPKVRIRVGFFGIDRRHGWC